MRFGNGHAVRVVHILGEGILQEEQLIPCLQQGPVLCFEVGVQRHPLANIIDVLHGENVHRRGILGLLLAPRLPRLELCLQLRERLCPGCQLLLEVLRRHQVLDAGGQLRHKNPLAKVVLALGGILPLVLHLVEAFGLLWHREVGEGLGEHMWGQVRSDLRREKLRLLLLSQRHLRGFLAKILLLRLRPGLLLHLHILCWLCRFFLLLLFGCIKLTFVLSGLGLFLVFLGLLFLLLSLPLLSHFLLLLGHALLLLLLRLLDSPGRVSLVLLDLQDFVADSGLVVLARLPHHNVGHLLEVCRREALQDLRALLFDEVGLDLHNDVIAGLHGRQHRHHLLRAHVVQARQAIHVVWLVIGRLWAHLWPRKAGSHRPLLDPPVTELRVGRLLFQEAVQPVESAFVWKGHGHDNFTLAILWRGLHLAVGCRSISDHSADEGHLRERLLAHVHHDAHVAVADVREQRFANQVLRKLLRLAGTDAICEEADCVRMRTLRIQVQYHSHALVTCKFLHHPRSSSLPSAVVALVVEEHCGIRLTKDQRGACCGEANSHELPHLLQSAVIGFCRVVGLHDLELEHVAAGLQPNVSART
mmetsp:Transcript_88246/g.210740  ORF Transcript_88246/g.210740 Transcript_88246/m.210740 type:complete len:587 (+) Transcript_88246:435-2195(+)